MYKGSGQVFINGVWLLTIVTVIPTTISAPASHWSSRNETDEKWMYPCGKHFGQPKKEYDLMISKESNEKILKYIIAQAQTALSHAESFKKEYVQKTFDLPFEKHDIRTDNRYDWLPNTENEILKKLGRSVKSGNLESRSLEQFLKKIYESFQGFAVGIEQVVRDQKKSNGEFQQHFNLTEVHLKRVLCEVGTAMIEWNIIPNDNVERSIMSEQHRNMETASFRNLRDWLIFSNYMNGLQYVIEVFQYIEKNHQPSKDFLFLENLKEKPGIKIRLENESS